MEEKEMIMGQAFFIDREYLDYVNGKVDKEVSMPHTDRADKGRANAVVMNIKYKGAIQCFALPITGSNVSNKFSNKHLVELSNAKFNARSNRSIIVSKLMPINEDFLHPFLNVNNDFREIEKDLSTEKISTELIAKTKEHLKSLENGKTIKFATNVDKQLQFLNARAELLNQGISQEEIYNSGFECNVLRAETFRAKENQVSKQEIKSKVKELEIE